MKHITRLDKNHLLSVLGCTLDLPYRHQAEVKLLVPFSEYAEFVRMCVQSNQQILNMHKDTYQLAMGNDKLMKRLFYYDVSKAVETELVLTLGSLKECTSIVHEFEDSNVERCGIEAFQSVIPEEKLKKAVNELCSVINGAYLSAHNKKLFQYAIVMRALSYVGDPAIINIQI